jgi:hypothetical protein
MVLATGLALGPVPALAQDVATQTAPSQTPATDSIGPRDLQNFSLNGTVTRAADPVDVPRPATRQAPPPRPAATSGTAAASPPPTPVPTASAQLRSPVRTAAAQPAQVAPAPSPKRRVEARPASSVTVALPALDESPVSSAAPDPFAAPADGLGGEHRLLLWPWLLAALALGAGGAFLFWRNRSREVFAGGPQLDAFVAPEPAAPPRAAPPPKAPPAAAPSGIVSTRLRPWIDLVFQPGRCIIEDDRVTLEFELGLQNSGNAPARGVLVEASLLNAGPYQDQEVGDFYGAPVGEGERIAIIPPLKTVMVKTRVSAPLANVQLIEIGGRRVFVPLIAFNTLYGWSNGDGQTSASYLLGRDGKGEKMGPFRLDLGPRVFRNVGARQLPIAVRK